MNSNETTLLFLFMSLMMIKLFNIYSFDIFIISFSAFNFLINTIACENIVHNVKSFIVN